MHPFLRLFAFLILCLSFSYVHASENAADKCQASDTLCLTEHLASLATHIEKDRWRDQIYRELSKTLAAEGYALKALPYIKKIKNPDTQALTIRGIGMEAAMAGKVPDTLFQRLREAANLIADPPSHGIALTYIAMAQAYAGDDEGAHSTATAMKNESLRNKAYAETAEIQAEKGKFDLALKSIAVIESLSFKNKAYKNVSRIFTESNQDQDAYEMALLISNPVMKAEAIQFILDTQRKRKEQSLK